VGATIQPGDIVLWHELKAFSPVRGNHGISFNEGGKATLLSRLGSGYTDDLSDDGQTLRYQGHNIEKRRDVREAGIDVGAVDQSEWQGERLSSNGLLVNAVKAFRHGQPPKLARHFEKGRGWWAYNGTFRLVDYDFVPREGRNVFVFTLELVGETPDERQPNTRVIPGEVKAHVWKRDGGRCVKCGSGDHLHFDHILPWSKGGTSLLADNIQLLCAFCNISKGAKIED
jgi:hypothetical protein